MTKRGWMFGALVAIGSFFGSVGAHAEIILSNWTFNANGVDGLNDALFPGAYTTTGVDTWDFNAGFAQNLNDNGNGFFDVGETGTVQGVGLIQNMLDGPHGGGTVISSPWLNRNGTFIGLAGYEVTFTFQVGYQVTSSSATGFDFQHTAGGLLNIYVDNLGDFSQCNTSNVASCSDGTLVAQFVVLAGDGGTVKFTVFDGSDDATFQAVFLKDGVWTDENGNDLGCDDSIAGHECNGDPLLITDSNFDADPNHDDLLNTNIVGFNCANQTAIHNCGFEDGSAILAAVPEPTSLAIFSIGLVMLGGFASVLRQRPN
jgi:hypothetical protein